MACFHWWRRQRCGTLAFSYFRVPSPLITIQNPEFFTNEPKLGIWKTGNSFFFLHFGTNPNFATQLLLSDVFWVGRLAVNPSSAVVTDQPLASNSQPAACLPLPTKKVFLSLRAVLGLLNQQLLAWI